jgi:hypothetical protein
VKPPFNVPALRFSLIKCSNSLLPKQISNVDSTVTLKLLNQFEFQIKLFSSLIYIKSAQPALQVVPKLQVTRALVVEVIPRKIK